MDNYDYSGEKFLNRLYKDLHLSDEVMHTAEPSDNKEEKVKKYLDRLKDAEELAKSSKHNGIDLFKRMYYKRYVIKKENIPESYFELQKKIALERGQGHIEIGEQAREELSKLVIDDQKKSLDMWLDYFLSDDSVYPEWFKYYAFQGMLKLGSYDKEKEEFNKRTKSTTNIFVELNREALALVYDSLSNALEGNKVDDELLNRLLDSGSFSKLYAHFTKKLELINKDVSSNEGMWVKYNRGSEPDELVKSLEGKGTGWCTAGYQTAKGQLADGDFYVYYTADSNGDYKQPRIAIRMEGNEIGEIRGIAKHQNMEPEMEEVVNKKLEEFPDRDKYMKKVSDMEKLTKIYDEYKDRELTIQELRFLYEIDEKIEGFGYSKDPRIKEIIDDRNLKKDLSLVFNCSEDKISNNKQDVLDGKEILYFYGTLDLGDLKSIKGITFPTTVSGNVDLNSLKNAKDVTLPTTVEGSLWLDSLIRAEGITFPTTVGEHLSLPNLKNAKGATFPTIVGGNLDLSSLKDAEGVKLPITVGSNLFLNDLKNPEGLIFPTTVVGNLWLDSLKSAKDVTLPTTIGAALYLNSLKDAEGLVLPTTVGASLYLNGLENAEGITFPTTVGYFLYLTNLKNAEGVTLPNTVGTSLLLNSLRNTEDVTLPTTVVESLNLDSLESTDGLIVPNGFNYGTVISPYVSLNDMYEKSLENNQDVKQGRQLGFATIIALSVLSSLVSIGLVVLGVFLDI